MDRDGRGAAGLAPDGNACRVTAEGRDTLGHPAKSGALVCRRGEQPGLLTVRNSQQLEGS